MGDRGGRATYTMRGNKTNKPTMFFWNIRREQFTAVPRYKMREKKKKQTKNQQTDAVWEHKESYIHTYI